MKAIIIDDEPDGIKTLEKMLALLCPDVEVVGTAPDATVGKQKIESLEPDLVLLDIQMPGKSGLDLLAELEGKSFEVVFVTAFNEYMLQALQFSAADYLLKPVDEDRLVEAIERVSAKLAKGERSGQNSALIHNLERAGRPGEMRLCLPTFRGFNVVKLEDIIYCEAERSYTVFHFIDGKPITVSKPLAEYESVLKDTSFLRIHKSFLVNLLHVVEYQRGEGGTVVLTNKHEIEVSRRKKEMFLERIKEVFRA